jgi:hypothetical protein
VVLVDADGALRGEVDRAEAIARARGLGKTLVEVNPLVTPPVCRILDAPEPEPAPPPVVGKMFHDPLAACCAIDPAIGTWAEVELFRERGQWGSRLCPGSNTWIIVDHDRHRFWSTLTHGRGTS